MNYLVIGGTTGIGKNITDRLLEKGHHVTVASRNATSRMDSKDNLKVHDIDATDANADWSFLPEKIHGVAYCGGTINLRPFNRLSAEEFEKDFKINVIGAVNTIQAAMSPMKKADHASIVMFSSVAAQRGLTFHTTVSAAKGGVEGLVKALSAELAPKIRVNACALSLTDTPLAEQLLNTDKKREAGESRHPLNRYGKPEDAAAAAVFLLSEDASWVTGQIVGVDGGMGAIQHL